MVCNRCKLAVRSTLENLKLHPVAISLGEVDIAEDNLTAEQLVAINTEFATLGFELIDDKKSRIIEKIKNVIIKLVHYSEDETRLKHSEYISQELHYDYSYLSKLFSEVEGITIEHYIISQKIEKAKELLVYDELSLSEIADQLGYSSVAHLSAQFKKVTGLTPSHFKKLHDRQRFPLDDVEGKNI